MGCAYRTRRRQSKLLEKWGQTARQSALFRLQAQGIHQPQHYHPHASHSKVQSLAPNSHVFSALAICHQYDMCVTQNRLLRESIIFITGYRHLRWKCPGAFISLEKARSLLGNTLLFSSFPRGPSIHFHFAITHTLNFQKWPLHVSCIVDWDKMMLFCAIFSLPPS